MKDFRLYDVADFVMDEDFIRWVQEQNHTDNLFWKDWLALNPSRYLVVSEARRIVESIKPEQRTIAPREVKTEITKVLGMIRDQDRQNRPAARLSFMQRNGWRAAAVIFLLAVGAALLIPLRSDKKREKFAYAKMTSSPSFIEKANASDTTTPLALPDGSSVLLAANSRIGFPANFGRGNSRDVYLSGEAFFTIAREPGHPFRVFANEIVTKVLGTSFSVRCFEKDTIISITVKTGKVSVCSQIGPGDKEAVVSARPTGIIVTPNQRLVYQRSDQKFQKILVESPSFIVPGSPDLSMSYEDRPVEEVFDQLGKYYGINIVYDNDLLRKCTVTADLTNESFYHKLDLICKAIGAKYELLDGQVVIQSNGCH